MKDKLEERLSILADLEEENKETPKKKEPLQEAIMYSSHLSDEKKELYLYLASIYLENMGNNIFKNQFELAEENWGTTIDGWQAFLSDKIISVYIDKHKRTLLKMTAEDNLATPGSKNKRDSIKLIESLEQKDRQEQDKNVIIIRLPDIYDN